MSDKTVGIIGQKYEDRKTGKSGTLVSRDDKYKTLLFTADDNSTFSISNSSFRSNWRKVKDETESVNEEVEETTQSEEVLSEETIEPEDESTEDTSNNVTPMPKEKRKKESVKKESIKRTSTHEYDELSEDEAIAKFVEDIMSERQIEVIKEANGLTIIADNVTVACISDNGDNTYHIAMLPDLFTLVDWKGKIVTSSIEYKTGADLYLGVILDTKETCVPELLSIIKETVSDINVYGYTVENDEEEETENGEN